MLLDRSMVTLPERLCCGCECEATECHLSLLPLLLLVGRRLRRRGRRQLRARHANGQSPVRQLGEIGRGEAASMQREGVRCCCTVLDLALQPPERARGRPSRAM